ncbi:hypothetical protein MIR68_007287 [Amoeboaphelidium protococcarum]|nr:hypothetical protein MIR68_007287 [Amoeboaphelidium protococcarum]
MTTSNTNKEALERAPFTFYLSNLASEVDKDAVQSAFSKFGTVKHVFVKLRAFYTTKKVSGGDGDAGADQEKTKRVREKSLKPQFALVKMTALNDGVTNEQVVEKFNGKALNGVSAPDAVLLCAVFVEKEKPARATAGEDGKDTTGNAVDADKEANSGKKKSNKRRVSKKKKQGQASEAPRIDDDQAFNTSNAAEGASAGWDVSGVQSNATVGWDSVNEGIDLQNVNSPRKGNAKAKKASGNKPAGDKPKSGDQLSKEKQQSQSSAKKTLDKPKVERNTPSKNKIHVRNLPFQTSEYALRQLFEEKGFVVSSVRIARDNNRRGRRRGGLGGALPKSRGYGFVELGVKASPEVEAAVESVQAEQAAEGEDKKPRRSQQQYKKFSELSEDEVKHVQSELQKAITALQDLELDGRKISVSVSMERDHDPSHDNQVEGKTEDSGNGSVDESAKKPNSEDQVPVISEKKTGW